MKVLQLCHKMPYPPSDGGAQVMHFTTTGLVKQGIELSLLAINPSRNFIDVEQLPPDYRQSCRLETVAVDTRIKPLSFLTNLFRKESYLSERFSSKEFEKKLAEILQKENFDIIQLEHLYLCKFIAVMRRHSKAKIVLRPQNVEFVIWERYLKNLKNPFKKFLLSIATQRLKVFEQSCRKQLDGVIALTKDDAEIFSQFDGNCPVIVIAMGYDYEKLKAYDFDKQFNGEAKVYHLGAMDWLPNAEAIAWFLKEVFPILSAHKDKPNLYLAGRNMPESVFAYAKEGIDVEGEITEPLNYQEDKAILIVPLWSGSGIRAKIIEGLALGKTIISTTIGAQGIDYSKGKNLIIADDPKDFAEQIIHYSQSPERCKEISKAARELSKKHYHADATAQSMVQFYNTLLN